jgi:hypothetical protein
MERLVWEPNVKTPDLYRDYTISFPGGSLVASKDILLSMFESDNLFNTCDPELVPISRKESTWTRYPGETPSKRVEKVDYVKKNYSNGRSSKSAGGEPIKVLINNSFWTARLSGSHQDFMDFLCANKDSLRDGFTYWESQAGTPYLMVDNSTST